jgi:hypothetical protein
LKKLKVISTLKENHQEKTITKKGPKEDPFIDYLKNGLQLPKLGLHIPKHY